MNSTLSSRLKPVLAYLLPVSMVSPSLVWIALDRSVWTWDPAKYGKSSVELFFGFVNSPQSWIALMLDTLGAQAPGASWLGQFFVPLGSILGSIDVGLLLSIWVTQAFTLALTYKSIWKLSDHSSLVANTGCLVIASAPLFVGMSLQYFVEPLQLLAVAWFVMIMSFAPEWNRATILSQLLVATAVAMLAKVSSPLYCFGPGLAALWYVFNPGRSFVAKCEWLERRVVVTLLAAVLLNLATIAWYYENITEVVRHVSLASSGPIAELYGKNDSLLSTILFWLGAIQNAFFLPVVLLISGLTVMFGVVRYFVAPKTQTSHFALCSGIAFFQIMIALIIFSTASNRDHRFLLPLLPYISLLISWGLAQIKKPLSTTVLALVFVCQLVIVYGQAFGIISLSPQVPSYLMRFNSDMSTARTVRSIVSKTCASAGLGGYRYNLVVDQKPWLNVNTLGYTAAKIVAPGDHRNCSYQYLGYVPSDLEEAWEQVRLLNPVFYITLDPKMYPLSTDDLDQTLNQLSAPLLTKVQTSGLFELEPPLAEDRGVLIFRRTNPMNRVSYTEALALAEHGVQSVRAARFGDNFELLGALLTPTGAGMELHLAWRSMRGARLGYMVAVHLVDNAGRILAQADFPQDLGQVRVAPEATWVDHVRVPAEKLKGVHHVGIALYLPGSGVEPIDRGPRDWDGRRLLLPLDNVRARNRGHGE